MGGRYPTDFQPYGSAPVLEIGGDNGQYALDALKNIFTRVGKPWRPATGDEASG